MTVRRRAIAFVVCVAVLAPALASCAPASDSVAVVGPSLAERAVLGYYMTGTSEVLWPAYDIGGGTLEEWAQPDSAYWQRFDAEIADHPVPEKVWLLLADHDTDYGVDLQVMRDQAHAVIANIRERTDAPIYATSMYSYTDPTSCPSVAHAVGDSATVRQELIKEGLVLPGPVLEPLDPSQLVHCDQNLDGMQIHGPQLRSFFG